METNNANGLDSKLATAAPTEEPEKKKEIFKSINLDHVKVLKPPPPFEYDEDRVKDAEADEAMEADDRDEGCCRKYCVGMEIPEAKSIKEGPNGELLISGHFECRERTEQDHIIFCDDCDTEFDRARKYQRQAMMKIAVGSGARRRKKNAIANLVKVGATVTENLQHRSTHNLHMIHAFYDMFEAEDCIASWKIVPTCMKCGKEITHMEARFEKVCIDDEENERDEDEIEMEKVWPKYFPSSGQPTAERVESKEHIIMDLARLGVYDDYPTVKMADMKFESLQMIRDNLKEQKKIWTNYVAYMQRKYEALAQIKKMEKEIKIPDDVLESMPLDNLETVVYYGKKNFGVFIKGCCRRPKHGHVEN